MQKNKEYKLPEFCSLLDLKATRTKEILQALVVLDKIEIAGGNKNRRCRLKQ